MPKKRINPVKADAEDVMRIYGESSEFYRYIEEFFEKNVREKGIELLNPHPGEKILEIGFGTGCSLKQIVKSIGEKGRVYGIDLTREMICKTKNRIEKENFAKKPKLVQADSRKIPFKPDQFDAVYMAFTLELFKTSDIRTVLKEIRRILKKDGRLGIVSLTRDGYENSKFVRIYEWFHKKFPKHIDCRPIYVKETLQKADFSIQETKEIKMHGICPVQIIIAKTGQ